MYVYAYVHSGNMKRIHSAGENCMDDHKIFRTFSLWKISESPHVRVTSKGRRTLQVLTRWFSTRFDLRARVGFVVMHHFPGCCSLGPMENSEWEVAEFDLSPLRQGTTLDREAIIDTKIFPPFSKCDRGNVTTFCDKWVNNNLLYLTDVLHGSAKWKFLMVLVNTVENNTKYLLLFFNTPVASNIRRINNCAQKSPSIHFLRDGSCCKSEMCIAKRAGVEIAKPVHSSQRSFMPLYFQVYPTCECVRPFLLHLLTFTSQPTHRHTPKFV